MRDHNHFAKQIRATLEDVHNVFVQDLEKHGKDNPRIQLLIYMCARYCELIARKYPDSVLVDEISELLINDVVQRINNEIALSISGISKKPETAFNEIKVDIAEPVFGQQLDKQKLRIHPPSACKGFPCPIHNSSFHKMRNWEINVRLDRQSLVERICPKCGCGHPDPDSVAYFKRKGIHYMGVHGCCSHPGACGK